MSEDITAPAQRATSRRTLLGATALGVAGSVVGFSATPASAHSTVSHNEILNQRIYYVGNGYPGSNTGQGFNATFYARLEAWLQFYLNNTPGNWGTPIRVNHLGVHSDADSGSMHYYGRAIDLSTIQFTNASTQGLFTGFDCRYNQWRPGSATTLKRYWAGVASLNYHLNFTLHYLYNAEHHDHVHVDNQSSGGGSPSFSTGSRTQVLAVQATLKYIWGYSAIGVDGVWGPQTNGYANSALSRAGRSGSLTGSGNWLAFNRASLRFGTGTQSY